MKTKDLLQPIEKEVEEYTEEQYDDLLDCDGPVIVCGMEYDPSRILKELDPIAYNCGLSDIQQYKTVYLCPICEDEYDEGDEALYCCQDEPEDE